MPRFAVGDRVRLNPGQLPVEAYYSGYAGVLSVSAFGQSQVGVVASVDVPPVHGTGTRVVIDYFHAYSPNSDDLSCSVGMRRCMVRLEQIMKTSRSR